MTDHILFLTGKLAEKQLQQVLEEMQPEFAYTVHPLGVTVAALMTADMIRRRLKDTFGATRIVVPGRCRGDLEQLSLDIGIPVVRGPDELRDLPEFFGKRAGKVALDQYDLKIFGEITDAPRLDVDAIVAMAEDYRRQGADVIDLGCLPATPFPHLEQAIEALHQAGFLVSVDSLEDQDLLRAGRAGCDYLLSLRESTLWISDEVDATPILIPETHGDLASLERAIAWMQARGRSFIADPILDPIHFGFADSLVRYQQLRRHHPEIEIMMGVGNITELTHADTLGMNAILLGICSELDVRAILATEVSSHAHRAIAEADRLRRMLYAARSLNTLPKHLDNSLLALHDRTPFPYTAEEIASLAQNIRDPSFRIQTSREGIHIFNRHGHHLADDPFRLYPLLDVSNDASHAFYLGVELARAQIAWQLGKRYNQDEMLQWGCATRIVAEAVDTHAYSQPGSTLKKKSEDSPS
ncbi:MAG: hypothetical protein RIQ52_1866 [Pseudomonadota bacterium]